MRRHRVFYVGLHALNVGIDVAIGNENVGPAVQIVVEEKTAKAESEQGSAADFRARGFVDEESFPFVVVEREHLVREIGDQEARKAGVIVVGGVHTHTGAGHAVFTESDSRDDGFFGEGAVAIVAIELVGLSVIRKQEIGPAVVVKIEHGDTESFRRGIAETGFLGNVFKRTVAAIVPEANGNTFVGFRRAVGFILAVEGAIEIGLRRPLDIVADDQVEVAILVVVDPGGAGAEFLRSEQSCFLRDIGERAVAIVMKNVALAVGRDENIVVTVIVVIPDGNTESKHLHVEAGFVGYVGEGAVVIVVIELRGGMLLDVAGPVHAVYEKNVRPAVIVVIDEGDARAHGFRQEFLAERAIVVDEADSRGLRDVAELNRGGFRRRSDSCFSGENYGQGKN